MKILVVGTAGEGKTTVGITIARALRKEGFEVEYTDPDGPEEDLDDNLQMKRDHMIARGTAIEVEHRQLKRVTNA